MDQANPKYFDYLDEYGAELEERFSIPGLAQTIDVWRAVGRNIPEEVGGGCRRFIELMLIALLGDRSEASGKKLWELIVQAKDDNLFGSDNDSIKKLEYIRDYGNNGTHAFIHANHARKCLESLDYILRNYINLNIDINIRFPVNIVDDEIFTVPSKEALLNLIENAKKAGELSGNSAIVEKAKEAVDDAEKKIYGIDDFTNWVNEIFEKLEQIENDFGFSEEIEEICSWLDLIYDEKVSGIQESYTKIEQVEKEIEKILSETDFIKMLLNGDGQATDEQERVLAFPVDSSSTTNFLKIKGGAGTGKTLCLLAKLIQEIGSDLLASTQLNMFSHEPNIRKALFVCYNTPLRDYVLEILANYPNEEKYIDVINLDSLVNQLVTPIPNPHSEYRDYANDVRYPSDDQNLKQYRIFYRSRNNPPLIEKAMDEISALHPGQAGSYYLNSGVYENVSWMDDEIRWLEARYEDLDEARKKYMTDERTGRGNERLPRGKARMIILEVWDAFRKNLKQNKMYTVEQGIKRLVGSAALPKYDLIAIDEAQDFNLSAIKLLVKFRASEEDSRVYIAGDEFQKIRKCDFSWSELDTNIHPYTITLNKNMRNSPAIAKFASRLQGETPTKEECSEGVQVIRGSDSKVIECLRTLSSRTNETTALIVTNRKSWRTKLLSKNISVKSKGFMKPGLHVEGVMNVKGLEFDNVVIANMQDDLDDEEAEKNHRNVDFTRARCGLYIFYNGEPPKLLKKYYPDFLEQ